MCGEMGHSLKLEATHLNHFGQRLTQIVETDTEKKKKKENLLKVIRYLYLCCDAHSYNMENTVFHEICHFFSANCNEY